MDNMELCEANNVPLTPITFLKRASECYPNRTSIIYGQTRFTWPQTYDRCCRLAASLISLNIAKNDVVCHTLYLSLYRYPKCFAKQIYIFLIYPFGL